MSFHILGLPGLHAARGEWTEKEGVSRKRKKKTYEQREASASTVTQCMQPRVAWQRSVYVQGQGEGGMSVSSCIIADVAVGSGA